MSSLHNRILKGSKPTCHIVFQKWKHPLFNMAEKEDLYNTYDDDNDDLESKHAILDMVGLADFKFYIGYTDFKINRKIKDIIDDVDGVESLEIYTPYRLRISVGKLFEDNAVISNINNQIKQHLFDDKVNIPTK